MGDYCVPILKIFLEAIIVPKYCLKLLSSSSCSYCMNGTFVNIIFASGSTAAAALTETIFSFQFQDEV